MSQTYVARRSCGCVRAAVIDYGDKYTAATVAQYIRDGYTVERMEHKKAVELLCLDCPHEQKQAELFARAEKT